MCRKFLRLTNVQDGEAEMVIIGDDVALEGNLVERDVGRRGLAGAVLLLKVSFQNQFPCINF